MGVLRYFPGSGPAEDPLGGAEPERTDPGWAVPGIEPGTPEPAPAASRASRRAENVALATLARHDTSEAELRAKLVARGLDPEAVDDEIDRLRSAHLLDDEALARRLVASLRERKGLGDAALRPALRARHLPQAVIDTVLAESREDDEVVQDRLQDVADDRARRLASLPAEVAERRLIAYLMRKGYSGSAVRRAAEVALQRASER